MRTKIFVVPKHLIALFFDQVDDSSLDTTLNQITEDEELVVEVHYDEADRDTLMSLIELVDDDEDEEEYEEEEEEEPEAKPKRRARKKATRR